MASYDPTDLRGQERKKAEAEKQQRSAQQVEDDDFKWLMQSTRGRRIVWRLLDQAGVFRISFTQNSVQTAFNEGGRNYGLKMINRIHALCPELYPALIKENAKENANVRSERNGNDADHSN